ncbi:uncharacterized protein I303_102731 [Kwoniella dejecticola CBS 10117]|uniref:Fungal lipase-type domain-containing protein n=1 Tax=Kwoniella dejecticola CBS 10117 TaxID=1296121 RepID=A0A1A6A9J2_9TREE|nr:uncharacterized protein I303_02746 [Kwoniella dejecticola CBS 10117]OBR86732.1 hypothetical protein I303_02746 [Kwoniella dejecticola CBS 10117]
MLHLATFLLLLPLTIQAVPSPALAAVSVLSSRHRMQDDLPVGKTLLPQEDVMEIARLAKVINSAYCSKDNRLQPHHCDGFLLQTRDTRRRLGHSLSRSHTSDDAYPHSQAQESSSIVISSDDPEYIDDVLVGGNLRWYISHTPSTQTLTLALSSLSSSDSLLDLLSSTPANNQTLIPLAGTLFPFEHLAASCPIETDEIPRIHHSYVNALATHGNSALSALLNLIDDPPPTLNFHRDILRDYVTSLAEPHSAVQESPITRIEIIGHGLGGVVGLLVAMSLKLKLDSSSSRERNKVEITARLFGVPRIGNRYFGDLVKNLIDHEERDGARSILKVDRITSYFDTIVHLPEQHLGLVHHSNDEIWVGPDPNFVYYCKTPKEARAGKGECSNQVHLGRTTLMDHLGPYGGVWVDPHCRSV